MHFHRKYRSLKQKPQADVSPFVVSSFCPLTYIVSEILCYLKPPNGNLPVRLNFLKVIKITCFHSKREAWEWKFWMKNLQIVIRGWQLLIFTVRFFQ